MSRKRKAWRGAGIASPLSLFLLFFAPQAHSAPTYVEGGINDPAPGWDLLWYHVIVDITIIGVVFGVITLYFMFKYKRKSPDQVGSLPKLSAPMAVGWALIPGFVFMADDFYLAANGWQLWNDYRDVPDERMEVKMEAGMYSWDYTYDNGVQTQNVLKVPAGMPVMLRMTSRDTVHSHFIPLYRIKEDSMPGRVTYLWFYPREEHIDMDDIIVTCGEYCGVMHSYMVGKVDVMKPADFESWYKSEGAKLAGSAKAPASEEAVANKESKVSTGEA